MKKKTINVITLGDANVGKTSIIQRIKDGTFNENVKMTVYLDNFIIKRKYEKKNIMINLLFKDTAGQEEHQEVPLQYIRDSHVVLLVFCDIKTLNKIKERWLKFYKEKANIENSRFILIGNKSDIFGDKREEIIKQGEKFAEEIDALFMTCSAKSDDNLDNVQRYIEAEAKRFIDENINNNVEQDDIKSFRIERKKRTNECCK